LLAVLIKIEVEIRVEASKRSLPTGREDSRGNNTGKVLFLTRLGIVSNSRGRRKNENHKQLVAREKQFSAFD
jgi:hypothetical protein